MSKRISFKTFCKEHLDTLTDKQKIQLAGVAQGLENMATAASMEIKRKTLLGPREIVHNEKKYWKAIGKAINELNLPYLKGWRFK